MSALLIFFLLLGDGLQYQFAHNIFPQLIASLPDQGSGIVSSSHALFEIPSRNGFANDGTPTSYAIDPRNDLSQNWQFGALKFGIILVGLLLWLRSIGLCSSARTLDDEERSAWNNRLVPLGLFGVLLAIFLPAEIPAGLLLLGFVLVPYRQFVRFHNQKNPRIVMGWWSLISGPVKVTSETSSVIRARLDELQLDLKPSGCDIQFVNASRLGADPIFGSGEVRKSNALQQVIAIMDHTTSNHASDIHITTRGDCVEFRQRIDGRLSSLGKLPLNTGKSVINIFKVLSDLNISDRQRSDDGSFLADIDNKRLAFRVSSQGTQLGEKLSIRILDPLENFPNLETLGMPASIRQQFAGCLEESNGLILFVGATGAGKSTSACASLRGMDLENRNIVTIEDPIEYQIPGIDQIEVNTRAGQSFEAALRSVLRLDADVIFIGEIRDRDTAHIACQAALTGQLVIATMHSSDSLSAISRLLEFGIERHVLASTIRAILAQSLVRKLCPSCKIAYEDNLNATFPWLSELATGNGRISQSPDATKNECKACDGRGFVRRTGIFELTVAGSKMRELIRENAPASQVIAESRCGGMRTLLEEGQRLILDGIVSPHEVHRVLGS